MIGDTPIAYYNENDQFAAAWLESLINADLIMPGWVDTRSIEDVAPEDLDGFTQCHFFAGIGGWPYALRLAGYPDDRPIWTGSCPCQPFSCAGQRKGTDDHRHLWPAWFRIIRERHPSAVLGEQVSSAKVWLDAVFDDLESEGYACGAAVLPACSVDAPHRRDRLWFVADSTVAGSLPGTHSGIREVETGEGSRNGQPERLRRASASRSVANPAIKPKREQAKADHAVSGGGKSRPVAGGGKSRPVAGGGRKPLANPDRESQVGVAVARQECASWSPEPNLGRVVNGVSHKLVEPWLRCLGNSIVPQVAKEFIQAYMSIRS